ncbi:MAG: ComEC/Rec2 family competence protein [bacterium]|nr:ComEC/Rec2 family competence protein [bacterium]
MSVKTLQTLLCSIGVLIIIGRYKYSLPEPITKPVPISLQSEVIEFPHTKNTSQIIKLNNQIMIITAPYPQYHFGDLLQIKGTINEKRIIMRPEIVKVGEQPHFFLNLLFSVRNKFEKTLEQYLPSDSAALAEGMLLGTTKQFSDEIDEAFSRTGTMHMIVVSGFNITLVATGILKLAGLIPRRIAIIFAIIGTITFVLLTGAQPPAVRAGMMAGVLLIGQFYGRPTDTLRALGVTVVLLLIHSPLLLESLSFQLSCASTLGILLLNPIFNKSSVKVIPKWRKYVKGEIGTSLSAQAAVTPLILNTFGSLSLIAPVTNLAVSWSVPYIMIVTLILCLAELIYPLLAKLMSFVLYPITAFFLHTILLFSRVPLAALENIQINWYILGGIYLLLAFVIAKNSDQKRYSIEVFNEREENE